MVAHGDDGIADDASSYEDLSAPRPRPPRPRAGSGIANDGELFADMLEETSDAARTLDSDWHYQRGGQVFGPVKARELLEMLYHGEIGEETMVSLGDEGLFQQIRRIGVFRVHLPRVEAHQAEVREAVARDAAEAKRRLRKRIGLILAGISLAVAGGIGVAQWVRASRERAAVAEKQEKEEALRKQLDELLASVSIEPPLMPLVEDEDEPPSNGVKGRKPPKRRGGRALARFSGGRGASGTQELSRQEIMEGVNSVFGSGIKRCIVEQIQRSPDTIPEQIVLTFAIDNDGRPRGVSLTDRHLRKSPLTSCLATQLQSVRWRAFQGEVQNVEYPITIGRR